MPSAPGIVAGVVSDAAGAAVSAARVSFVAGPGALPDIAALTDDQGAFTLSAPLPGDYTIQCVADGHPLTSIVVSVRSGERVLVRCRLES
jgi:Carboxypeptidase regulatory-like domain